MEMQNSEFRMQNVRSGNEALQYIIINSAFCILHFALKKFKEDTQNVFHP